MKRTKRKNKITFLTVDTDSMAFFYNSIVLREFKRRNVFKGLMDKRKTKRRIRKLLSGKSPATFKFRGIEDKQ